MFKGAHLLHCKFQHRLEESDTAVSNPKLRRVDSNGYATAARVAVITSQRSLASLIKTQILCQRQGVCGDHETLLQQRAEFLGAIRRQNFPSVT